MVKALAPALKTMAFIDVLDESVTVVTVEVPKDAVSVGTVFEVQLAPVFQSFDPGDWSHVALVIGFRANAGAAEPSRSAAMDPSNGREE